MDDDAKNLNGKPSIKTTPGDTTAKISSTNNTADKQGISIDIKVPTVTDSEKWLEDLVAQEDSEYLDILDEQDDIRKKERDQDRINRERPTDETAPTAEQNEIGSQPEEGESTTQPTNESKPTDGGGNTNSETQTNKTPDGQSTDQPTETNTNPTETGKTQPLQPNGAPTDQASGDNKPPTLDDSQQRGAENDMANKGTSGTLTDGTDGQTGANPNPNEENQAEAEMDESDPNHPYYDPYAALAKGMKGDQPNTPPTVSPNNEKQTADNLNNQKDQDKNGTNKTDTQDNTQPKKSAGQKAKDSDGAFKLKLGLERRKLEKELAGLNNKLDGMKTSRAMSAIRFWFPSIYAQISGFSSGMANAKGETKVAMLQAKLLTANTIKGTLKIAEGASASIEANIYALKWIAGSLETVIIPILLIIFYPILVFILWMLIGFTSLIPSPITKSIKELEKKVDEIIKNLEEVLKPEKKKIAIRKQIQTINNLMTSKNDREKFKQGYLEDKKPKKGGAPPTTPPPAGKAPISKPQNPA